MKRFVAYDGEDMQHFDTEAEAQAFAEAGLKCHRDAAREDNSWDCDDVVRIFWGEVRESVVEIAREQWWPDGSALQYLDWIDYGLMPLKVATVKDVCSECNGSGWVNAAGFKTIPTTDADPHRLPCGSCRPMLAPEPQAPPNADDTLRAESEARMKHFAWVERHSEAVLEVCKRQTDAMVRIAVALEKLSNSVGWPR